MNIINVELRYFIFQSVIKNVLQKICFLQILRPLRLWHPKAMAKVIRSDYLGHGLIGLKHKVALGSMLMLYRYIRVLVANMMKITIDLSVLHLISVRSWKESFARRLLITVIGILLYYLFNTVSGKANLQFQT